MKKRFEQWLEDYGAVMKVDEVAKELRMHPSHVRELCREHKIPAVRIGNRWRVDTERLIVQLENI